MFDDTPQLQQLIKQALANNVDLKVGGLETTDALLIQTQARSGFLPSIDFDIRYSKTFGGQDLGDLINPAYQALNQLTGSEQFPTNISLRLPLALEAKIRIAQPVYVPAITINSKLAALGTEARHLAQKIRQREIVAAVRKAYLALQATDSVVDVLAKTRPLLVESLRVSELLIAAQSSTPDTALRAKAALAAHDQKRKEAELAAATVHRQLQILLAETPSPRRSAVEREETASTSMHLQQGPKWNAVGLAELHALALSRRSELSLSQLETAVATQQGRLARSETLPTLVAVADLGVQSNSIDVSWDDRYAMLSLVASWNGFNGGATTAKRQRANIAEKKCLLSKQQQQRVIVNEVTNAFEAVQLSESSIATLQTRIESESAAYQILTARYAAGSAAQIDVLSAQSSLISAQIEQVIARTQLQQQLVELARTTQEPIL
jgi:outer membrane protein